MIYKILPIVIFDKGMMTYQHNYGKPFIIFIFLCYTERLTKYCLKPEDKKLCQFFIDSELSVIEENFNFPPKIGSKGIEIIQPETLVNAYEACEY